MCMSSIPARVMAADQNDLKPSIGRAIRLIARWSGSTILFRYFTWRSSMLPSLSVLYSSIAAMLAPLLSMVIFSGVPHWSMALRRKRAAALRSRLAVRRKSTVCPALSTARYILPLSLDADVRLVHAPARTHRALALPEDLIQHGRVLEHPAIQTGIGVNAALLHHFLQLPIADGINPIPTDTPKDDVPLE